MQTRSVQYYEKKTFAASSVRRILKRGGGGGQKFQKSRSKTEIVPPNLVRTFAQNQVKSKKKRSSLKFGPNFRPKSGDEQKKKKKRSSLKFGPIFQPKPRRNAPNIAFL